jgi:hypothetical protein
MTEFAIKEENLSAAFLAMAELARSRHEGAATVLL